MNSNRFYQKKTLNSNSNPLKALVNVKGNKVAYVNFCDHFHTTVASKTIIPVAKSFSH